MRDGDDFQPKEKKLLENRSAINQKSGKDRAIWFQKVHAYSHENEMNKFLESLSSRLSSSPEKGEISDTYSNRDKTIYQQVEDIISQYMSKENCNRATAYDHIIINELPSAISQKYAEEKEAIRREKTQNTTEEQRNTSEITRVELEFNKPMLSKEHDILKLEIKEINPKEIQKVIDFITSTFIEKHDTDERKESRELLSPFQSIQRYNAAANASATTRIRGIAGLEKEAIQAYNTIRNKYQAGFTSRIESYCDQAGFKFSQNSEEKVIAFEENIAIVQNTDSYPEETRQRKAAIEEPQLVTQDHQPEAASQPPNEAEVPSSTQLQQHKQKEIRELITLTDQLSHHFAIEDASGKRSAAKRSKEKTTKMYTKPYPEEVSSDEEKGPISLSYDKGKKSAKPSSSQNTNNTLETGKQNFTGIGLDSGDDPKSQQEGHSELFQQHPQEQEWPENSTHASIYRIATKNAAKHGGYDIAYEKIINKLKTSTDPKYQELWQEFQQEEANRHIQQSAQKTRPHSDSEITSLETNTQIEVPHLATRPTGIESNTQPESGHTQNTDNITQKRNEYLNKIPDATITSLAEKLGATLSSEKRKSNSATLLIDACNKLKLFRNIYSKYSVKQAEKRYGYIMPDKAITAALELKFALNATDLFYVSSLAPYRNEINQYYREAGL